MKHADDYFTATMPEPWQILGLRLRPFSLSHYNLLKRLGCAFIAASAEVATRNDLIIGVLACSMLPSEFEKFLELPDMPEQLKAWGYKCGMFDLDSRAAMFTKYLESHSVVPRYWEEHGGTASGAHWSHCIEVCLKSNCGWTDADLETKSLSKAFADYFKHAENEGAVKLMTPEEIEFIESQKEATANAA